ncbi:DsbA family protein [Kordiimonas aestuarii]|uniref:DsbA family protein n=1 Tax=Kordiimonas aestuarii TaxID=1005925 RepID=UPI0021D2DAE4|nr:DsbA family protein [Kordiimonas aestuarii]
MLKKAVLAAILLAFAPVAHAQDSAEGPRLRGELTYGDKTAKVEVIEYGSFTCPHCARFAREILPQLKADYIDTGKVKFIFRNFVRDRYDMAVAVTTRCTTSADTTKAMTETFFERQKEWMTSDNPYAVMAEIAGDAGVSQTELGNCISDRALQEHMVEMRNFGIESYQINAVPAILVNGAKIDMHSYEDLKDAIEAAQ